MDKQNTERKNTKSQHMEVEEKIQENKEVQEMITLKKLERRNMHRDRSATKQS